MKLSILMPAYNEEKRIEKTLKEYLLFFNKLKKKMILDFEIIVIINNTTDKTEMIVKRYVKKFKAIRYLKFREGGKGFAIIQGFKDTLTKKNDLIGFVDVDMATSPESFYDLVKNINNYDGIIASRWMKKSKTKRKIGKKITSRVFNFIVRTLFLLPYQDTQCGAKIFKIDVIEKILPDLNLTQWAFDVNLLYLCKKNDFKIKEWPTAWVDKQGSNITNLPKTSIQMFLGIVRLRLINSFFVRLLTPIKFMLKIGDRLINKNDRR